MKKRVLVVDDCADTRSMFTHHFENLGAEVTTASNGQAAISTVKTAMEDKRSFNLIIMDVRMPEMDGIEAARKIRDLGFSGVLAACTATSTGEGRRHGKEAGIDVYLDKMVLNKSVFDALLNKQ